MFSRTVAVVILLMVTQVGCGDGSTGPPPDIDQQLVGTWVSEANATDTTGVFLCTYVAMRLVLRDTGQFVWYTVDPPSTAACETTTFRMDAGDWRVRDGNIVFTPPPMNLQGAALELSYELEGDELRVGVIVFEHE